MANLTLNLEAFPNLSRDVNIIQADDFKAMQIEQGVEVLKKFLFTAALSAEEAVKLKFKGKLEEYIQTKLREALIQQLTEPFKYQVSKYPPSLGSLTETLAFTAGLYIKEVT